MKFTLYLSGFCLSVSSAVDCSHAFPWTATTWATANTKVHYEENLYENEYFANVGDVPGVVADGAPWKFMGACFAGSAGAGPSVSCSGVSAYSAQIYKDATQVTYQGFLYQNQWYAAATEAPGSSSNWQLLGVCDDSLTPVPTTAAASTTPASTTPQPTTVTPSTTAAPSTTAGPSTTPGATTVALSTSSVAPPSGTSARYFAPFMDATLSKRFGFVDVMTKTGAKYFMLGFIVAQSDSSCTPAWGAVSTLAQGPWTSFASDVAALRAAGGDIFVSFGGASNIELADATACQTGDAATNLSNAYIATIDAYSLTTIDFDIEGSAVDIGKRGTSWKYRLDAVKLIQAARPNVKISWTFPVLTDGLLSNALTFVEDIMTAGVRFDHINVMTMDFGSYYCTGDISPCEISSVVALAKQVFDKATTLGKASSYGWTSVDDVYPILGSTPMIGVNDVNTATYTAIYSLADAKASLAAWQTKYPIGWWSYWSLARDSPCASIWADASCSGANVQTADLEFAAIFAQYK